MKVKRKKEWVDEGFGFPVKLLNVPMVTVRGVENTPDQLQEVCTDSSCSPCA